jgi:hypothetical protein
VPGSLWVTYLLKTIREMAAHRDDIPQLDVPMFGWGSNPLDSGTSTAGVDLLRARLLPMPVVR